MADQRVRLPVKVVDAVTDANQLQITAAGEAEVSLMTAIPAGTNNIGDVDVLTLPGTAVEDVAAAGGETGHLVLGVRNDAAAAKTSADGDFSAFATDSAGRMGITDLGGSITVDGIVDTELPTAAALADAAANPTVPAVGAFLMGFNGTTWDRVDTANTGRLQVDVVTGGGSESPTNPTINVASSTAVAAGSSANLDSAEITEAEKLWEVHISASVPFKAQIQAVENGTARNLSSFLFGKAGETVIWQLRHRNFATHAGSSAGVDVFRAVTTNMDNSAAADLYAAFYYST